MPTPTLIEGWEHGVLDTHQAGAGTGIADSTSGTAAIDAASPIEGAYSLKLTHDRVTAANVTKTLASIGLLIGSSKFKTTASFPEQPTTLLWFTGPGNTIKIRVNTDGTIGLQVGSGATAWSAVVVTDGLEHRVDFFVDVRAATWLVDWRIDGVAQTQGTLGSQLTTGLTNFRWGSANAGDGSTAGWSVWHDDTFLSVTAGDYPLPNYEVRGYSPASDGSHNAGTNVIEADGGADIDGSTTTAFSRLDDVPLPTGAPSGDWVQQSQIDVARYAEVLFETEASAPGDLLGVSSIVAFFSSATAPNNGTTRIINGNTGGTLVDVFSGDMSESAVSFVKGIVPPPSAPWALSAFNALRARIGFSSDVTPIPRWCGLMLQAAFRIEKTGRADLTGAGSITADGQTAQGGAASLAGAGALSASGLVEKTGAAALTGAGDLFVTHILFEEHVEFEAHVPFGDSERGAEEQAGSATLQGTSGGSATGSVQASARADLVGTAGGGASAVAERLGNATLGGTGGLLAAPGPRDTFGSAALSGLGFLEASSNVTAASIVLSGFGSLQATAAASEILGSALLSALGGILADSVLVDRPSGDMPFEERAPAWQHVPVSPAREPLPPTREVPWASLDALGREEYLRALLYSHREALRVDVLDADEQPVSSLTAPISVVYDGSLQVDSEQPIPQRLTLSLADPDRALLELGSGSAVGGSVSAASSIAVTRLDWVPILGQWVAVPIFWGPVSSFARQGADATIEAMGKESLYQGAEKNWRSVSLRRGAHVIASIRAIAEARGETRFRLPEMPSARLQAPVTVPQGANAWPVLKRLAAQIGREIFFDAEGMLCVREDPINPAWVFEQPGGLVTDPQISLDLTLMRNAVHVVGKAPARGPRPGFLAVAPPAHPFSPQAMARNGVPRYIVERIETELTRSADCERVAKARLATFLLAGTLASFEARPLPPVQPRDVATLTTPDLTMNFRLSVYTQPLLATSAMQVGEIKYIPTRARRKPLAPGRIFT